MFSKSKRFDEKPVGCGADAAYQPKDESKPIGGVIPKVDRFAELKHSNSVKSDTESVFSDKSSQVFRTPKAVRRALVSSIRKKFGDNKDDCPVGLSEELMKEYLDAKNVEIRNKNETISDYENQMKELREKISSIYKELKQLSQCCQEITGIEVDVTQVSITEFKEHVQLCLFDKSCKTCQDTASLIEKLETIKAENQTLHNEMDSLRALENKLVDLEVEFKILKEEHDIVQNILTEFESECGDETNGVYSTKSIVAKVNFIIDEFIEKRNDVSSLIATVSQLECELNSLQNINADKDFEIERITVQNGKISQLEIRIVELSNNENRLSFDLAAASDAILSHKTIIAQLNEQVDEQVLQIQLLMKTIAMIKSHHALALDANESIRHEYKVEIDTLRAKHNEEIASMEQQHKVNLVAERNKYTDKLAENEESHRDELKHKLRDFKMKVAQIEETSTEKLRLCEIQFEERYDALQLHTDSQLYKEREIGFMELKACQEKAENKILYYTNQITELQKLIDVNDKKLNYFSDEVHALRMDCDEKQSSLEKTATRLEEVNLYAENQKSSYEKKIDALQNEIDRVGKEKLKFALTLETTRQAVEVISARLRNSDNDVEMFKNKLDEAVLLNDKYEMEISKLKQEFDYFKKEYSDLLKCLVESKSALDKNNQAILKENSDLIKSLTNLETDMSANIDTLKTDLCFDIEQFKEHSQRTIDQLQFRLDEEQSKYLNMKAQCDIAFDKIGDCQQLLSLTEVQMESKDQELSELSTENVRLSGTLVALEQEKNELALLLNEFVNLSKDKDRKLHNHLVKIEEHDLAIADYEEHIRKLNQLLEGTEFIVKEKDNDIKNHKEDIEKFIADVEALNNEHSMELLEREKCLEVLQNKNDTIKQKYEALECKISEIHNEDLNQRELIKELRYSLKQKDEEISVLNAQVLNADLHFASCDLETLQKHCKNLEMDLEEMTTKYTNLLGHQNNKQKIRHVIDLKAQNSTLKEENEKLTFTVEKHVALIEKLKKELAEANKIHSPLAHRKQFMHVSSSGKENITARFSQSPNRLGSPKSNSDRALTPFKDSNR